MRHTLPERFVPVWNTLGDVSLREFTRDHVRN